MTAAPDATGAALPPLAPEDHVCRSCDVSYPALDVEAALVLVTTLPAAVTDAVDAVPVPALRVRPTAGVWSVVEYTCHLRDVAVSTTVRLHRARVERCPVLEPLYNDWRALRFRYVDADLGAVQCELAVATRALAEEAASLAATDWDRPVTRLPGEQRTARWILRQSAHEGVHHVRDIVDVGRRVGRGLTAADLGR